MKVNVYTHRRTDSAGKPLDRPPLVLAYTRYEGDGACVHDIPTTKGDEAKRLAIKEHRVKCLGIT